MVLISPLRKPAANGLAPARNEPNSKSVVASCAATEVRWVEPLPMPIAVAKK
jgi:hypothetical protein